ncbi:hypothetical protein LCGC14_2624740, partial [marine sediment metagenome]
IETNVDSCTATFTQHAGVEALGGSQEESRAMIAEFQKRRNLIHQELNKIRGIKCLMPRGAFYIYPNVTEACCNLGFRDSKELQQYLLHQAKVAVLARSCFGKRNEGEKEEYIRLSYVTSRENIIEGVKRIKEAIEAKS